MGDCQPPNSSAPSDSLAASFAKVEYGPPQESQHIFSVGRIPTPRWGHFRSIDTSIDMIDAPPSTGNPSATHLEPGYNHRQRRRLPSPISEDESMLFPTNAISPSGMTEDMILPHDMRFDNSGSSTEHIQRAVAEEPASTQTRGKAKLSMGYRVDCEKCRARVPGHYNHVIRTWLKTWVMVLVDHHCLCIEKRSDKSKESLAPAWHNGVPSSLWKGLTWMRVEWN